VTYWSAEVGPYIWHEFDAERTRAELHAMAGLGIRVVRTLLPWDAFMPSPSRVETARIRDMETLLATAERESLSVVPVLFAQSIGDCIMLPAYAIDVSAARRGVRVVTDAVVQPGGPRDQYTDPVMIDSALSWLEGMLRAFAGHPALQAWDVGHDPATTMRPRRIDDMRRWVNMMSARIREHGERCTLTLGTADIVTARGVRPGALATALDGCGVEIDPSMVHPGAALDARATAFIAQLTQRLLGEPVPVTAGVYAVQEQQPSATESSRGGGDDDAAAYARDCIAALVEHGCAAVHASAWANSGPRNARVPPVDRFPSLGLRGLVDVSGNPTLFGSGWRAQTGREFERRPPAPWPDTLDVEDYYANLPESVTDLRAMWEGAVNHDPGMLS